MVTSPLLVREEEEDGLPAADQALTHGRLKNSETLCKLEALLQHLQKLEKAELAELIRSFPFVW